MKFSEVVKQAIALLRDSGRLTYRTLKREFALDDAALEDLKFELIEGQELAVDKDGKMLVWKGTEGTIVPSSSVPLSSPPPVTYTPPHLVERIQAERTALEARGGTEGERKTITALFADLKGSTVLIEGLDPEEARAIIDPALQLMMDAVHRYEGYVAQALGDGIFALFGAPIAHEDHPQRALYAALRMQEDMRRYGDTLRHTGYPPLLMRVGVNTGEVVMRSIRKDDLHADYVPVGHSTNLAARMEQLANPGAIVVSAYTHKLTDGYFAFKDLGATQIKGVEEPLHVYEVLGAGPLRTQLQVTATRRGLTRFVGRQSEMEQLHTAWEHAKTGQGQIVGVMGEPGLGKSRLFYEFKRLSQAGCLLLEAYSVSHGKASPYLPVIELLKNYFDIQPHDDERKRREKVGGKVLMLDRSLEDTLLYLFALLGIEEHPSPLRQMDPQIRRRQTFDALKKLFLRESLNQPLVLIFEDLHWIDGETQGFLDVLSESIASAKILLLTNYRPEYRHEWGQKTYYTQLRLSPLGQAEAQELLIFLLGNDASLVLVKQLILDKTQGTPFFMEEMVQTLAEEGALNGERGAYQLARATTTLQLPPTVQGILAARIDRLAPDEKALLQQLAVVGRQFPLSLIRQVIAQPEVDLYRLLVSLQRKEFLYEQPAFPESEYLFKHALTQEVAYGTVLHKRRKALHERTAQAMEALYSATLQEHYSDLAHHYSCSDNTEKAIEYLQKAGQQAVQGSIPEQAVTHLTAALQLLETLPNPAERIAQELRLQLTLGPALQITKGYGSTEAEQVYTRARVLCQQVGETPELFPVLWGLSTFYRNRGDLRIAYELDTHCLALAERVQSQVFFCVSHRSLGLDLFLLGEFSAAQRHLEQALTLYDPQQFEPYAFLYGGDLRVVCLSAMALLSHALGYPEQALVKSQEALTRARTLPRLLELAFAECMAAFLHQHRQDFGLAQQRAEAAINLSIEHGFRLSEAQGSILRGCALAEQGRTEEGFAQVRDGLANHLAGTDIFRVDNLSLLAQAYTKAGLKEDGLRRVAEALAVVDKAGSHMYEAELYRLKGTLTLQSQSLRPGFEVEEEAEAYFHKAIAIARTQQAKSWELRAATSLARLWQQQGKKAEAHNLLSEVYNWFTEGFDTKDLQEAKALLDELAEGQ